MRYVGGNIILMSKVSRLNEKYQGHFFHRPSNSQPNSHLPLYITSYLTDLILSALLVMRLPIVSHPLFRYLLYVRFYYIC